MYNRLHNARLNTDLMLRRIELCRKRMTEAWFLYTYLELGQRYGIKNYQIIVENLDNTILLHHNEFQEAFSQQYMKHTCEIKGCPNVLTIDGGLKPHRLLCGAKLSGIQTFESSGVHHFTGCKGIPSLTPTTAGNTNLAILL